VTTRLSESAPTNARQCDRHGGGEATRYVTSRRGGKKSLRSAHGRCGRRRCPAVAEGIRVNGRSMMCVMHHRGGGSRGAGERCRRTAAIGWRSMISGAIAKWGGDIEDEDEVCDGLEGFSR
jgi:hypothetical protein